MSNKSKIKKIVLWMLYSILMILGMIGIVLVFLRTEDISVKILYIGWIAAIMISNSCVVYLQTKIMKIWDSL